MSLIFCKFVSLNNVKILQCRPFIKLFGSIGMDCAISEPCNGVKKKQFYKAIIGR